jgi:hypothetical protein
MSSTQQPSRPVGRLRAAWRALWGAGPTPEQERMMELQRAHSQVEQERLNAHRRTGHFGGTGW